MVKRSPQTEESGFYNSILLVVLFLGLVLRLWGVLWDLPISGGYSHHPDEAFQVAAAANIDFGALKLNPQFYNYGAMYMYLVSAATGLASALGFVGPGDVVGRYLAARLVTVLLGAAIPYFVWLTACRVYDRKIGLVAALLAAIAPIAVVHSHFATVDVPAAFWVAVCLAVSAALARKPLPRSILLAGVFAGFAGATKYTALIVVAAPVTAIITGASDAPFRRKALIGAYIIAAAIAGFIIGNPGSVLWTDQFLKDLLFEVAHVSRGDGLVFANTGPGWLLHFRSSLLYGLGLPYLLLAVAGLCLMVVRRPLPSPPPKGEGGRESWFLVVFSALYLLVISLSPVRFARYVIPLTPVLAIAAALTIVSVFDSIPRVRWGSVRARQILLAGWLVACLAAIYYTLSYSIALDSLFSREDPRRAAANWITTHVPKGSTIALATQPWFYSPALSEGFTDILQRSRFAAISSVSDYELLATPRKPWDSDLLNSKRPNYVVISDYEDVDAIRAKDPAALRYLGILRARYSVAAVIANRLRAGGLDFGTPEHLPHDLKYVSPRLTIYKRRT